ncbi:MAG TPA: efflux RND transporter periplasmic adaptor subunit [Stellaceae bacterium]|jgi:RND family efflux transporter MFP subunit|nr:efflux RND transporter periplasmic adaptor subunit [Stellaceae bacterium]
MRSTIPQKSRRGLIILLGVLAVLLIAIFFGIHGRVRAEADLAQATENAATPIVNVTHPEGNAPNQEIALPGNVQAFSDTPIYARTSGYLKHWYFDIGAHVKQGDLLAEIDTPEVDDQLQQARADLATAQANLQLAEITAKRNEELLKSKSIATQDRDNAVGTYNADKTIVNSKQADVTRLERLQSYEKVYAPFAGIITARATDVGALIDAGAAPSARELFHLSAIDKVRIYVAVPEAYSRAIQVGSTAAVTLDEFPGKRFDGALVRTANAIDPATRTLMVEVDVDNPDGELLPGAYASVHLPLPSDLRTATVTVPSNTLIFRKDGLQVALVRDGKAQLVPVKIGRDYGDKVEIVSGLKTADDVILDPADSLVGGSAVQIKAPDNLTASGSAK